MLGLKLNHFSKGGLGVDSYIFFKSTDGPTQF